MKGEEEKMQPEILLELTADEAIELLFHLKDTYDGARNPQESIQNIIDELECRSEDVIPLYFNKGREK